jgi:hypothetical protein
VEKGNLRSRAGAEARARVKKEFKVHTLNGEVSCELMTERKDSIDMKLKERIEQIGATGYILLWLLGIPIPVLFLFFLLRGCN